MSVIATKRRPLISDQAGATILEFAFVFPVLILLIMGIFEYAMVFYMRGVVEEVTRSTARQAITGAELGANEGLSRQDYLDEKLMERLSEIVFVPENISIKSEQYDRFDDVSNGIVSANTSSFGQSKQIVQYTVRYQHEYLTPLPQMVEVAISDPLPIMSTAFVQNEDF